MTDFQIKKNCRYCHPKYTKPILKKVADISGTNINYTQKGIVGIDTVYKYIWCHKSSLHISNIYTNPLVKDNIIIYVQNNILKAINLEIDTLPIPIAYLQQNILPTTLIIKSNYGECVFKNGDELFLVNIDGSNIYKPSKLKINYPTHIFNPKDNIIIVNGDKNTSITQFNLNPLHKIIISKSADPLIKPILVNNNTLLWKETSIGLILYDIKSQKRKTIFNDHTTRTLDISQDKKVILISTIDKIYIYLIKNSTLTLISQSQKNTAIKISPDGTFVTWLNNNNFFLYDKSNNITIQLVENLVINQITWFTKTILAWNDLDGIYIYHTKSDIKKLIIPNCTLDSVIDVNGLQYISIKNNNDINLYRYNTFTGTLLKFLYGNKDLIVDSNIIKGEEDDIFLSVKDGPLLRILGNNIRKTLPFTTGQRIHVQEITNHIFFT